MDKTLILKGEIRKKTGTHTSVKVRESGQIPAIIYGHKEEPVSASFNGHDFEEELHHGHRIMDIEVGGKKQKVLVKALQYDHLGRNVIHADLIRVDESERVKVMVAVELKGVAQAKGVQEGGVIESPVSRLEVECQVIAIPESIVVNVTELELGGMIHAGDITMPEGSKLVSDPSALVALCKIVVEVKTTEELEAEAPTTPEVIGEKKEEEGAEEEEKKK